MNKATMTATADGYRIEHDGRWCEVVLISREEPESGLLVPDPPMVTAYSVAIRSSHGMNDLFAQWSRDEQDTRNLVALHACECLRATTWDFPDRDFGLIIR